MHQLLEYSECVIVKIWINRVKGEQMRIQDNPALREIDKKTKGSSPAKGVLNSFFSAGLSRQERQSEEYDADIETLRKEIEEAGNKLTLEPTLPNFKQFRDLLSRLVTKISAEAYRLEKFGGTPQNPRYYEIITVINSEADKLYNLVVKENRDNMAITAKVIGIKGLVVDLIT